MFSKCALVRPINIKETETVAKTIYIKWFWNSSTHLHRWSQSLLLRQYEINFVFVLMRKTRKLLQFNFHKMPRYISTTKQPNNTRPHLLTAVPGTRKTYFKPSCYDTTPAITQQLQPHHLNLVSKLNCHLFIICIYKNTTMGKHPLYKDFNFCQKSAPWPQNITALQGQKYRNNFVEKSAQHEVQIGDQSPML